MDVHCVGAPSICCCGCTEQESAATVLFTSVYCSLQSLYFTSSQVWVLSIAMSVTFCLSARISQKLHSKLHEIPVHVNFGRGSTLVYASSYNTIQFAFAKLTFIRNVHSLINLNIIRPHDRIAAPALCGLLLQTK